MILPSEALTTLIMVPKEIAKKEIAKNQGRDVNDQRLMQGQSVSLLRAKWGVSLLGDS